MCVGREGGTSSSLGGSEVGRLGGWVVAGWGEGGKMRVEKMRSMLKVVFVCIASTTNETSVLSEFGKQSGRR